MSEIPALLIGALILVLFWKLLSVPLKFVWKMSCNALLGWLMLWVVNSLTAWTGVAVPVTFWTALGVGVFGIPGLVALILYMVHFVGKGV